MLDVLVVISTLFDFHSGGLRCVIVEAKLLDHFGDFHLGPFLS